MSSKPFALIVLIVGCLVAGGGGAYLASRGSSAIVKPEPAVAAQAQPVEPGLEAAAVNETEAVIAEAPPLVEAAPAPATRPTIEPPVKRQVSGPAVARPTTPRTPPQPIASASRTEPSAGSRPPAPPPSGLEKPWPARDHEPDAQPEAPATPVEATDTAAAHVDSDSAAAMTAPVSEKLLEELIVSADSVLGLQMETSVSTERAKLEDRVEARVTRDLRVGNAVAIPAGTRALGSVTTVERGGKLRERARLGIRFHTLVLADGTQLPVRTETIYRDGESPARASAAKIGGAAIGGAIIGGIFGGKRGAVLGGSAGAAGGTAVVMSGDRSEATIQSGSTVTVRLSEPVTVTVEK